MSSKSIPAEFHQIDMKKTILQSVKFFALWLIPGALAYYLSDLNSIAWSLVPFLALIGGHGLQCVALLGHEGTHFALHEDKWKSALAGIFLSSFVPFHMDTGFAVSHAEHHAFTNTDRDPDHIFFGQFKNFFSRLFLARIAASNRYLKMTLILAFNKWPKEKPLRLGLSMKQAVTLARVNILTSYAILAAYIALTFLFPKLMIFVLWIPFIVAMLISGLRPFVEHLGTESGRGNDSRSWISPVFDILYGSINYHQAHHLWPKVPSYNLKKLHFWVKENQSNIYPDATEIRSISEFIAVSSQR